MALLYERSAIWRAIVSATRDPRILALFTMTSVAGGYVVAKCSQKATSGASEQTKVEMEGILRKDAEAARYASHSKNALAIMLDNVKPQSADNTIDSNAKYKKNPIKLPGVMWHPKIAEREREQAALKSKNAVDKTRPAISERSLRSDQDI